MRFDSQLISELIEQLNCRSSHHGLNRRIQTKKHHATTWIRQTINSNFSHYLAMKEFPILQNCTICGQGFDSDYKLVKHLSTANPASVMSGWVGESDSCSCGSEHSHHQN